MRPFLKAIQAPPRFLNDLHAMPQQDIDRIFARCFATEDGKKVLAQLQVMAFARAYGPDAPDQYLRYAEGQRALVAQIMRMIDRGRTQN